jgi:hypothetical protein
MKAKVLTYAEGLKRGKADGVNRTLVFCMIALNNEYGFKGPTLVRIMAEALRVAEEADRDPEWVAMLERRLQQIGLPLRLMDKFIFGDDDLKR